MISKLRLLAGVVITAALTIMFAPAASADPTVSTGSQIEVRNASGNATCTLGPRVVKDSRTLFLTSGHCAINNMVTEVLVGGVRVGTITHSGSPDSALSDVAVVEVDQSRVAFKIAGGIEQTRLVDPREMTVNQPVCKVGGTTGRTCGRYLGLNADGTIGTNIPADHGDSGAPVFVPFGGNRAGIIGMVSRGNDRYVVVTPIRQSLTATQTLLSTYNGG